MGLIGLLLYLIGMVIACCWPILIIVICVEIMEIPNLPVWILYPTCVLALATSIFYVLFWQPGMEGGFGGEDN